MAVTTVQGDLHLLDDPVAQELLGSRELARLAYSWLDGTPRVVPIWFHWTGETLTFGSPPKAPKVRALQREPQVAVTIDASAWPPHVLLIRGEATVQMLQDVSDESAPAARRYFGEEQGNAWVAQ